MTAQRTTRKGRGTVLVVDDDFDFLEQYRIRLEKLGFTVHMAESQAEGEALVEELDLDLAIFDLMLENPEGGFVLSYKMKKKDPSVPVILVTGVAGETGYTFDASTSEMRGWVRADLVLDKPLRFAQLEKAIDGLMRS